MGRFTAEEDQKILDLVKEGLEWPEIASRVDGRNTKQIRDRWNSKLDPELKSTTEPWTEDEDALLYHGYQAWGSAWGQVTSLIKGRSSNMATACMSSTTQNQFPHRQRSTKEEIKAQAQPRPTAAAGPLGKRRADSGRGTPREARTEWGSLTSVTNCVEIIQ